MTASRVDNFQGSIKNYVIYLENKLGAYEERLAQYQYYGYFQNARLPSLTDIEPCQLPISQCDPRPISSAVTHPPAGSVASQPQEKPLQRDRELKKFLSKIPTPDSWEKRRQKLGLNSKEDFVHVLATLVGARIPGRTFQPTGISAVGFAGATAPSPSLERAYIFAISTSQLGQNTELLKKTLSFRHLLLASYCEVLVQTGEPADDVDQIMSVGLQRKSLERYRRGAVWVHRRIAELYSCGWGDRASELFLLCGCKLAQYGRFSDSGADSGPKFLDNLKSEEYTSSLIEIPELIPLSIPCMIQIIAGDTMNMEQICRHLKYPENFRPRFEELLPTYEKYLGMQSIEQVVDQLQSNPDQGMFMSGHNLYTQHSNSTPNYPTREMSSESTIPANKGAPEIPPGWDQTPANPFNAQNGWDGSPDDPFQSVSMATPSFELW